jgi:dihydrofolate synthase/folylpolyglutamate synthase
MLAKILGLHGLRVGHYTSPHLVRVEERIKVSGDPISSREFCLFLSRLKRRIEILVRTGKLDSPPTYFETLTCLALLYFEARAVDIAVLEVGMGGRLDATNAVMPLVSVITTVGMDHQEFLGHTLERIAYEKAGVVKPGVPVICGPVSGTAYRVVKRRAQEVGAPFRGVFDEKGAFTVQKSRRRLRFSFRSDGRTFVFSPSLPGEHQGRNAAVTICAAEELSRRWRPLETEKIIRGIEETRWEGRLEVVSRHPLFVLDGAHNPQGARAVAAYARDYLPRPMTLVLGIMKDKNIKGVAAPLFKLAKIIILATLPSPRAASAELIFSFFPAAGRRVLLVPDTREAVLKAMELTPARGSILAAGSLVLVGEVKKLFPSSRRSVTKSGGT